MSILRTLSRIALVTAMAAALVSCNGEKPARIDAGTYRNAPVIVISIDTLRADHLPAYGYDGVKTPNLDALRRDSVLFANAYSHVPLTLPSHTTLLTGKLPAENGVRDNIGYRLAATNGTSLPETLHAAGYATGAAVSSYVLRGETGLRALFESYDDAIPFQPGVALGEVQRPGAQTMAVAKQWIAAHEAKPFFYFVHLFEPHAPYDPPEPYRGTYADRYDGEIAYADALVGSLLDDLKARGIYRRALIVLLSDHGEGLGDHGEKEHGIFLYREAIHVPLMIKLPEGASANATVSSPAGLIDVFPTIAALVGARTPAGLHGTVLTANAADRRIFSETMYPRLHLGWSDLRSLSDASHHFIDAPRPELYDVAKDPGEKSNVLSDERRVYAALRKELEAYPRELKGPGPMTAEEMAKLTALNYLAGGSNSESGPLPDPKDQIGAMAHYEEAGAAAASGQYERAIELYRGVVQKNPRFTDALYHLGGAYEKSERFEEAAATYRELLRANPSMTEQVAIALGAIYMNLGRYDDAKKHAELALHANPGGARLLLGRIAMARKDYAGAEREARAVLNDPHYGAGAALLIAQSMAKRGDAAGALAVLDQTKQSLAARKQPPLRDLELARADALMHLNRVDEALAAMAEEARTFPDNRDAYTREAAVFLLQNRPNDANAALQALVTANPSRASYTLAADTLEHFGQSALAATFRSRGASAP